MRRPSSLEVMLLTTVVLWALNLTVTRYVLTHGFEPLAYATVRYGLAAADLRRDRRSSASGRCGSRRSRPAAGRARGVPHLPRTSSRSSTRSSDERVDDRADPRGDADLRRADRARARARAAVEQVLDRCAVSFAGVGLVARRERRRVLRRPRRDPARARDRRDLGGLLGRDRAADAALLRVTDQRRRAVARAGSRSLLVGLPQTPSRTRARLGGLGAARRSRRSGRSC